MSLKNIIIYSFIVLNLISCRVERQRKTFIDIDADNKYDEVFIAKDNSQIWAYLSSTNNDFHVIKNFKEPPRDLYFNIKSKGANLVANYYRYYKPYERKILEKHIFVNYGGIHPYKNEPDSVISTLPELDIVANFPKSI